MNATRELIVKHLSVESQKEYERQIVESEAKFATFSNQKGAQIFGFTIASIIKDAVDSKAVSSVEEALEILNYSIELSKRADVLVREALDNMIAIETSKAGQTATA